MVSPDNLFPVDNLSEKHETCCVIVVSGVATGKTTHFTKVVPLHWAENQLWFGMFDLVIAHRLRFQDVRQAKNVTDLLGLNNFEFSTAQKQDVLQFIIDHPHRVCHILNGLDETSLALCSDFIIRVV